MGNYIGVTLEARVALGVNVVRAVFRGTPYGNGGTVAAERLRESGFAVTEMPGRGRESEVAILDVVVRRKNVPDVLNIVEQADPTAFVTVEEVRTARNGYMSPTRYTNPANRKIPFLTRV